MLTILIGFFVSVLRGVCRKLLDDSMFIFNFIYIWIDLGVDSMLNFFKMVGDV